MQRARCYLLGETAVVLELEPPVTLESQKRIWGLTQRLTDREEVVEVIPGMNNITVVLRKVDFPKIIIVISATIGSLIEIGRAHV